MIDTSVHSLKYKTLLNHFVVYYYRKCYRYYGGGAMHCHCRCELPEICLQSNLIYTLLCLSSYKRRYVHLPYPQLPIRIMRDVSHMN